MAFNMSRSCLPSAHIQIDRSTDLNEELRNLGAPALTTTSDAEMFEYNDPHSRFELAAYNLTYRNFYPAMPPPTTTTQVLDSKLPLDAGDDIDTTIVASRERLQEEGVVPVSSGSTSKVDQMVSKQRKTVHPKGVTGRVIGKKVDLACLRCREFKQKCGGEKPSCWRCTRMKKDCFYVPGQQALKKRAAALVKPVVEVHERPKPAKRGAVGKSRAKAPLRTILPSPKAPAAELENLATKSQATLLAAELNGDSAEPPGLEVGFVHNLEDFGREVAGVAPVSGRSESYAGFATEFGTLDAGVRGSLPPCQPGNAAYGGYMSPPNEPFPSHNAPDNSVPRSAWSSNWNSPSTRRPILASEATIEWAERSLANIEDPGMGFLLDRSYQLDWTYEPQPFPPFRMF